MKLSLYNNVIKKEDYYLIHNPAYGTMLKVYDNNLKDIVDKLNPESIYNDNYFNTEEGKDFYATLCNLKMFVEKETNEMNILNYKYKLSRESNKTLEIFMIPTMQCNFRCPYCYEDHKNDIMTKDIYENSIKMIKNLVKTKDFKHVVISWFGGEPSLELDSICEFMSILKRELPNVEILGQMTSNAYLLTPDNFKRLIEVGVKDYQITIDGPKEIHNKTRILANGEGTWDTIINNLLGIKKSDLDFKILIRSNFTKELLDNIDEWFRYLSLNFGDDDRFRYHFETVKNLGGDDTTFVFKDNIEPTGRITKVAKKYNLKTYLEDSIHNFSLECYASRPWNFVIYFDGTIKKCTIDFTSSNNNVGTLNNDGMVLDEERMAWWTSYEKKPVCHNCRIYPVCFGRKCPNVYYSKDSCDKLKNIYDGILLSTY
ncbi:radical SAM/SPASM domain-containing protein [Clostridium tetani]|uniref:radical SAM/SPASM domain-containing protein n=1 Tax=Clostridium tetani TaxID=1513 RepID=UPI0005146442|nr:radical SAM protein [Clostridium tetani]KGI36864.1 hypothetical protein LA33_12095 [Clostridium tetani ATCC 9441]SUY82426.1 radical SAM additional 4Fe4S-binding domain protein [Clostridium tetani]